MAKYSKFFVALLTAVVEGVAVWQDAPSWVLQVAAFAGAALVWLVPNREVTQT